MNTENVQKTPVKALPVWRNVDQLEVLWAEIVERFQTVDLVGLILSNREALERDYSRAKSVYGALRLHHGDSIPRHFELRKLRGPGPDGCRIWDDIDDPLAQVAAAWEKVVDQFKALTSDEYRTWGQEAVLQMHKRAEALSGLMAFRDGGRYFRQGTLDKMLKIARGERLWVDEAEQQAMREELRRRYELYKSLEGDDDARTMLFAS